MPCISNLSERECHTRHTREPRDGERDTRDWGVAARPLSPGCRRAAAAAAGALLPRYRPLTYRGRPERWAAGVWARRAA